MKETSMISRLPQTFFALTICLALLCVGVSYCDAQEAVTPTTHHHYTLIDLGTLGGRQSYLNFYAQVLNRHGMIAGFADTPAGDPHFPNFDSCANPDCLVSHAIVRRNGIVTDLGALTPDTSSAALWVSDSGMVAGVSGNGLTDPLLGVPEIRGVLWKDYQINDLGTLGGNESFASAVNSRGTVVGVAANGIPDDFSFFGWGTQARAFAWRNGAMRDLGTLGGPDAFAVTINDRGQIAGNSYTDSTPNPTTGIPTVDPFLWQDGRIVDLGTLGGTFGVVNAMNLRGQVAGDSNLVGDNASHPFLWDGERMIDLGSFGGNFGDVTAMNDSGDVVGSMNLAGDDMWHAFFWHNGTLTDLGTLDKCSTAWGINNRGQIVGGTGDCGVPVHAVLWEKGRIINLTSLVPPHVQLTYALNINERGEIAALGRVEGDGDNGVEHAFLLIPATEPASAEAAVALSAPASKEFKSRFRLRTPINPFQASHE
jgi:probable HAF family extracellular repeat protein